MPNLNRVDKSAKEELEVPKGKEKKRTKDKALWITGGICAGLVALICLFVIIYPRLVAVPDVTIPDVNNLTVVEAEAKLKEYGLSVASEIQERENDDIEVGKVIGTSPQVGRTVKEGTEVTIIIAKKSDNITMDDYSGINYKTAEANLKNAGLNVIVEQRKVEKEEQENFKYKEFDVIDQSAKKGTVLEPGDTIVLYYAVFTIEYPDFVQEGYSVDEVSDFCAKNDITLNIEYVVRDEYEAGTIISQNRTGEVISGSTLTITVTEKTPIGTSDSLEDID